MKLVTYEINGTERTGILNSDETWIYPSASFIHPYADMNELIRQILPEERNLLAASAGHLPLLGLDHFFDHIAPYGSVLLGSQIAVVSVREGDSQLAGNFKFKTIHSSFCFRYCSRIR